MVISFYDDGVQYDLVIERDEVTLEAAWDFLDTFYPDAHLISFREVK